MLHGPAHNALAQDESGDVRHRILVRVGGHGGKHLAAFVQEEHRGGIELHHLGGGTQHGGDVVIQRQRCREEPAEPVEQLDLGSVATFGTL